MKDEDVAKFEELLARAREGDPEGRDRLFQECRRYLGFIAQAQVESWLQPKVDASDLVQQTLFEAHRDFQRFEGTTEAEWLAWLRKILSHNALDCIRQYHGTAKRQVRREVPVRTAADGSSLSPGVEPRAVDATPSEQLIRQDECRRVSAALEHLSEDHRQVIQLRNLERLSFNEVADRMGRSRPAVQMLWMRALKKLQEVLEAS